MGKYKKYIAEPARFSREWWLDVGKNTFWVALVTVLIWVYADFEFTTTARLNTTIRLTARADDIALLAEDATPRSVPERSLEVTFTVSGNQVNIDRLRRRLADRRGPLSYDLSSYGPGRYDLDVAALFEEALKNADLPVSGLSIDSVTPSQANVWLDELETLTVPVELDYVGAELAEQPSITPKEVQIRVLKSSDLPDDVAVKTQRLDLRDYRRGETHLLDISLAGRIGDVPVDASPTSVKVTLKVEQNVASRTLEVPVQVLEPSDWAAQDTWQRYELQRKDYPLDWKKSITVEGPREEVARLRPEQIQAYIVLTEDDRKPVESWLTREVTVRFPPRTSLRLAEGERPAVSFKLVERDAGR
jgi:hypothetical protein